MTRRIRLSIDGKYVVDNYEVKPFNVIDNEEPIMRAVGEINEVLVKTDNKELAAAAADPMAQ